MLFILYLLTVAISFAFLYSEYQNGLDTDYEFKWYEKLLGLIIIPVVPILNLVMVYVIVAGKENEDDF